ncbi:MAG: hypothetical protein U9P44_03815, partial [archaeon]|nr:hypothetical protein [archaeon]
LRPTAAPKVKRDGFSISIRSGTGQKPKINIRTFGDVDREKIEKELSKKFGITAFGTKPVEKREKEPEVKYIPPKARKIPKITEEPKTDIKRLPDRIIIETELPDIESEEDIMLNIFTESIELKAIGKNKMYFRIMQIPAGWTLSGKKFEAGVLKLEFRS